MTSIWAHRFEVVMRPLRDLGATPTKVFVETRTAAQAGRDAMAQFPDMKVLSVSRASADEARVEVVPLARAAGRR